MENFYCTAPSEEIFIEIKKAALGMWSGCEDPYKSDKIERIESLQNVSDNAMYMVAMLDMPNQGKLASKLSEEARSAIRERMIAGGSSEEHSMF